MKKSQIELLFKLTKGTDGVLNIADARRRDKFFTPLLEATKEFEQARITLYEAYCTKNEDGTPAIENGVYTFPTENIEQLNQQLSILYAEDVELPTVDGIAQILALSTYKPLTGEAEHIDALLAELDTTK